MKTANCYPNWNLKSWKKLLALAFITLPCCLQAQNLVTNPGFTNGTTGWTSGCSVEIYTENVYGGTSATNNVTEIDMERCLDQTICIFPGATYTVSYKASRRISGGTPATVGVTLSVTGVTSGTAYVNQDNNYSNTSFAFTTSTYSFSIPAGSTDRQVRLHIQPLNSTTTYGLIVDDLELRPQTDLSINGTNSATQNLVYNYSVNNCPVSGVSYNWNFGTNATPGTSTLAAPSTAWTTTGSKSLTVALSNNTCTIVSLNRNVAVTGILPVNFLGFTGAINNSKTVLNFSTSDEVNAKCFIVEKSTDARSFDSIGRIEAYNTPGKHHYSFTEPNFGGTAWYRIRQVDLSGSYHFSSTVVLKSTGSNNKLVVFPSQAHSAVQYVVNMGSASTAVVQVVDATGKPVISVKEALAAGASQHTLDVSSLSAGVYFLKLQQGVEVAVKQFQKL